MDARRKFGNLLRLLLFPSTFIIGFSLIILLWRAGIDQQILGTFVGLDLFGSVLGLASFVCIYAVFTVCLIPTLPMNVLAGFIWGGWTGGLISCLAVSFGSWVSFVLSRSVLRQRVKSMAKPNWFERMERHINQNDWQYLIFLRMNPIFPTGPINYLVGLTDIKSLPYLACTFLSLLLPSTLVSFAGSLLGSFTYSNVMEMDLSHVIILMAILSILFIFLIFLQRLSKKPRSQKL